MLNSGQSLKKLTSEPLNEAPIDRERTEEERRKKGRFWSKSGVA